MLATGCAEADDEGPAGCTAGLPEHPNSVTGNAVGHDHARIALSPDGQLLAGGGRHRPDLLVWDTATGRVVHRFDVGTVVRPVWLGPATLCWATDQAVVIADLDSGDVRHLATAARAGGDAARPQMSALVSDVAGDRVAFIAGDGFVGVAEVTGCDVVGTHRVPGARSVGLTAQGVVVESPEVLVVLEPDSGEELRSFGEGSAHGPMVWSPDGTVLAIEAVAGWSAEARVLDASSGDLLAAQPGALVGRPVAFSADGALLAGIADDGSVRVWHRASAGVAGVEPLQQVSDVALSPDLLVVWGPDSLDAWNWTDATVTRTFTQD